VLGRTVTALVRAVTVLLRAVTVLARIVTVPARIVTILAHTVVHRPVREAMHAQTATGLTSIESGRTSTTSGRTLRVQVPSYSDAARAKRAFLLAFTRSLEGDHELGEAFIDAEHNRAASGRRCT
jgi:hypothetical protein